MSAQPALTHPSARDADPETLSADALAEQIVELSAHLAAGEARLLELIARFDEQALWAGYGTQSCAHWLNWQCGMSLHAARERVRVARALAGLPRIREAFERGEVSYSKVRAMTRVAVPESEEMLLSIARHGTAAHMDRLVRQAIDSAVELLYRDGVRKKRESAEHDGSNECSETAAADVTEDDAEHVVATLDGDGEVAVTFDVRRRVPAGTPTGAGGVGEERGDVPAGTSASSAVHAERPPPLPCGHEGPNGYAVVEEFEGQEWNDSIGARRADALRLLAESHLSGGWRRLCGDVPIDMSTDRYQVVVHIDQALLAAAHTDSSRPLRCELDDGPALALDTARRLACDSALVGLVDDEDGEPLSVGRKTRAVPSALRRALRARDGGCRFPSCDRTLFLHAHHVVHWANGGETKLSNLVSLCTYHHTLVHEGGFGVEATDGGGFMFYDPAGEPLPATGRLSRHTLEALARAAAEKRVAIVEANRVRGREISAETAKCRWAGERMDYHLALDGLLWRRDQARRRAASELAP